MSISDISQIDEFIEHAQFHSEQYGDNVFVFISKHYGELKKDHNISTVIAFIFNSPKEDFKIAEFSEFRTHNFFYQEPTSSLHSKGLFQPPRQS